MGGRRPVGLNDVVVRERDGVRDPSSSDCLTVSQSVSHALDARWTGLVFETPGGSYLRQAVRSAMSGSNWVAFGLRCADTVTLAGRDC